tara:strand:- start:11420 stop:11824 length:405 start_codon:yes stop_codon:yes gene_type:complete
MSIKVGEIYSVDNNEEAVIEVTELNWDTEEATGLVIDSINLDEVGTYITVYIESVIEHVDDTDQSESNLSHADIEAELLEFEAEQSVTSDTVEEPVMTDGNDWDTDTTFVGEFNIRVTKSDKNNSRNIKLLGQI